MFNSMNKFALKGSHLPDASKNGEGIVRNQAYDFVCLLNHFYLL